MKWSSLFRRKIAPEPVQKSTLGHGGFIHQGHGNSFRSFLLGGAVSIHVDHRMAYSLRDRAAPLANVTNRIVDAVGQLALIVVDADNNPVEESEVLKVLRNPGFGQTCKQVIEDFTLAFLLTNNAYLITDAFKSTLRTVKPFFVEVRADLRDSFVTEYTVTSPANNAQSTFRREVTDGVWRFVDLLNNTLTHTKTKTTNDGLEGRSPIEPILVDIAQRIAGGRHNLSLLNNSLNSSVVFETDRSLSDDQFQRLKEGLEDNHAGADNAGKPMILDHGLKQRRVSTNNREMDYISLISMSAESISMLYKVPLPLTTTSAQTFSNFQMALLSFYDDAVFPVADIVLESIARTLEIEEGFRLTFDKEQVSSIRERILKEAKLRSELNIFSDNEQRVHLNVEPYVGGDTIFKPANMVPVGADDGALDDGDIEGEKSVFIKTCLENGNGMAEAEALWKRLS